MSLGQIKRLKDENATPLSAPSCKAERTTHLEHHISSLLESTDTFKFCILSSRYVALLTVVLIMVALQLAVCCCIALFALTHAVSTVTYLQISDLLSADGAILAAKRAPVWMFAQSQCYPGCVPTWAFGGQPNQNYGCPYVPDYQTSGAGDMPFPQCKLW